LIFAHIGLSLAVKCEQILDEALFSAMLIMVMNNNMITPPLLQ